MLRLMICVSFFGSACAILCTRIARSIHEFMIYFSLFPAPTTALHFSYSYPTHVSCPAHPASASDVDRFCILKVMETVRILLRQALIREERMARCRNRHVCSYPHTVFKCDRGTVQKCTLIIDKTAFSKVDIDTVFTVKWCKNHCSAIRCGRNQFFQKTLLSFMHPQRCAVKFITGFHSERMVFFQIFAVGIVESPSFHSFPVIHVCSATQNVFK